MPEHRDLQGQQRNCTAGPGAYAPKRRATGAPQSLAYDGEPVGAEGWARWHRRADLFARNRKIPRWTICRSGLVWCVRYDPVTEEGDLALLSAGAVDSPRSQGAPAIEGTRSTGGDARGRPDHGVRAVTMNTGRAGFIPPPTRRCWPVILAGADAARPRA
ncbi:hypothetical protein LV779_10390 [Streptomyces thinghirensis]|nr:hypothetical protein [Streptomyces thinghirensis]